MSNKVLYHTVVENHDGIHDVAKVISGSDLQVTTANPVADDPETNSEQLVGLALATCLNATIEAEEKRRSLQHASVVQVGIKMGFDNPGFQFWLDCQVKIPEVNW